MAIHRYAVVDENGQVVNVILADTDAVAGGYWPGYGAGMIDQGEEPPEPAPPRPTGRPGFFQVLSVNPTAPVGIGDTVDLTTGEVTPAPVPEPTQEEPQE